MKVLCWGSFVQGNQQVHSQQFSNAKSCFFNVNQKSVWTNSRVFYNERCVWRGYRKCPSHRYWILMIPWLNKQTGCIAFPMKESTNPLSSQTLIFFFRCWKSCWTNRWVVLIRNLHLCEQSCVCQVQPNVAFNHWWPRSPYITWLELWSWYIRNKHCVLSCDPHWTLMTVEWFIWCAPL